MVDLTFAILSPIFIHSVVTMLTAILQRRALVEGTFIGIVSLVGSTIIGFVFLAKRWRRYAIPIGITYVPAMIVLLIYLSLIVQGNLLRNWL
jgi:cytochrome c oxidase subunit IV